MSESKLSKVKKVQDTDTSSIGDLLKAIYKALGSTPGKGGDLIVPAMGTHNAGLRKRAKQLEQLSKSIQKSRPIKKRVMFQGMPINLEFLKGDSIEGEDERGPWKTTFKYPYGEIAGTRTWADKEPLDVYLGPNKEAKYVYIVHQKNKQGKFDEDKCFLGFSSPRLALSTYYSHCPWWGGALGIEKIPVASFKQGYLAAHRPEMRKAKEENFMDSKNTYHFKYECGCGNTLSCKCKTIKKATKVTACPSCKPELKKSAKPTNMLEEEIATHTGHFDSEWSKKFEKFGFKKLDVGTKSNKEIQAVYNAYQNMGIPAKYFSNFKGVNRELHFEKPLKSVPSIKGMFSDFHTSSGKDGKIYIFSRAFDYINKPYRVPGRKGLDEIITHETLHFLQNWSAKDEYKKFMKLSGWTKKKGPGKEQAKRNPKWFYDKTACFVTDYASAGPNEHFAETGTWYVLAPNKLKKKCPKLFKFFHSFLGNIDNKYWEEQQNG